MPRRCCHSHRRNMPCGAGAGAGRPRICLDSMSASRFPHPVRPIPFPARHASPTYTPQTIPLSSCYIEPEPSITTWEEDCDSLCDEEDVTVEVVDAASSAYCPYETDEECFKARGLEEEYIIIPNRKPTRTLGTDPCVRPVPQYCPPSPPQYYTQSPPAQHYSSPPPPQYYPSPPPPHYCEPPPSTQYSARPSSPPAQYAALPPSPPSQYTTRPPPSPTQYSARPPPPRFCRQPNYSCGPPKKLNPVRYAENTCSNNTCGLHPFAQKIVPLKKPICCSTNRHSWAPRVVGSLPMNTFAHGPLNKTRRCSGEDSTSHNFSNQTYPGRCAPRAESMAVSQGVGNSKAYITDPSDANEEHWAHQPARCEHCGANSNFMYQPLPHEDNNRNGFTTYNNSGVDATPQQNPYAENCCNTHAMGPEMMTPRFMDNGEQSYMREPSGQPCVYPDTRCSVSEVPITIELQNMSVQHPDVEIEIRGGSGRAPHVEATGTEVQMEYIDTCRCSGTSGGVCGCSGASTGVCKCKNQNVSKPVNFKCGCPKGSTNCDCLSCGKAKQGNKQDRQKDCSCPQNLKLMIGCTCWSNGKPGTTQCGCTDQRGNRVGTCQCSDTNGSIPRKRRDKVVCKCYVQDKRKCWKKDKKCKKKTSSNPDTHSSLATANTAGDATQRLTNDVGELQREIFGAGDVYEEVKKNVATLARDMEQKKILSDDMTEKVRKLANGLNDIQKAIVKITEHVHSIKKTEVNVTRAIGEAKSFTEDEDAKRLINHMPEDITQIQTEISKVTTVANDIKNDITTFAREIENSKKMDDGLKESTVQLTRNLADLQAKATNASLVTDSISKDVREIVEQEAAREEEKQKSNKKIVENKHAEKPPKQLNEKASKRRSSKERSYNVNNVQINDIQIDARNGKKYRANQLRVDTFTGRIENQNIHSNVFLAYSTSQSEKDTVALQKMELINSSYICDSRVPVRDLLKSREEPMAKAISFIKQPRTNNENNGDVMVYFAKREIETEAWPRSLERPHNISLLSPKICKAKKKRENIMLKRVVNIYDHFDSIVKDSQIVLTSGASGTLKKTPSSYERMKNTNKRKSIIADTINYQRIEKKQDFEILYVNELNAFIAETAPREPEILDKQDKHPLESKTEFKVRKACGADGGRCYCTDIRLPDCGKKAEPSNEKTGPNNENEDSTIPTTAEVQTDIKLNACECSYPPAYAQLSCTGKIVGNCCCGKFMKH